MVRGVDLEAAARNLEAVGAAQKKATIEQFEASILAVHHLPHKAERAALIKDSGVLELLGNDAEIFTSTSPQVLELKKKILARAADWQRYFAFKFEAHQTPISFLTRAAKCLGMKFNVSRSGSGDRPYQYQVCTVELIDNLLAEAMENLELARAKYFEKTEGELDQILETQANKSRQQFFRKYGRALEDFESELFNEVIKLDGVHPLELLTAVEQGRLDKLLALRSEVEIRKGLLESVLAQYAAASVVSISGDSDIENVDGGVFEVVRGDRSAPDLATG